MSPPHAFFLLSRKGTASIQKKEHPAEVLKIDKEVRETKYEQGGR